MAKAYPNMTVRGSGGVMTPSLATTACTACQGGSPSAPVYVTQGEAPGYSVLSSSVVASDPMPIGVMRTSYNTQESNAPGYATVGPVPGRGPQAAPTAPQPAMTSSGMDFVSPPRHKRPHILSHLFGLDAFGHRREMIEAERKSDHAALRYGQTNEAVTELPASLVYGQPR
jgi:hypothetical protein